MPEQQYGRGAVKELRAMETYKKTKKLLPIMLAFVKNNVDPKHYKRNHRKFVSIRS